MSEARLWPYALEVYGRPGGEAALLAAQDLHGQCIPYLLWALWLVTRGGPADSEAFAPGAAVARTWQDAVIAPLRGLRRKLKAPVPAMPAEKQARLRERIRALELEAERMLLETLEAVSPAPAERGPDAAAALAEAVRVWGGDVPAELLARLAALGG
ncbi:MAG TPA: TIGR02444 family protein [Caulobacteraceae bacterium]|nr:TIGR02444 family protein [Caulobacteraceae bacterium]